MDKQLLNNKEKEYLSAVIKPFRENVKYICKHFRITTIEQDAKEFILISLKNEEEIWLPYFNYNKMYKGMEQLKYYTLEELGL